MPRVAVVASERRIGASPLFLVSRRVRIPRVGKAAETSLLLREREPRQHGGRGTHRYLRVPALALARLVGEVSSLGTNDGKCRRESARDSTASTRRCPLLRWTDRGRNHVDRG